MDVNKAIDILRNDNFPEEMGGTERIYTAIDAQSVLAKEYLKLIREDDGEVVPEGMMIDNDTTTCYMQRVDITAYVGPPSAHYWTAALSTPLAAASIDFVDGAHPTLGQLRALVKALGGEA